METKQHLIVIGPNLPDQSRGQFHVHDAECAAGYRLGGQVGPGGTMEIQTDSRSEIVEYVYDCILDECVDEGVYETIDEAIAEHMGEFHFCPCVTISA